MSSEITYPVRTHREEHDPDEPRTKKVSMYGWDSDNLQKRKVSTDESGYIKTSPIYGSIDTGNSSITTLGVDAIFTGESIDIMDYPLVFINVYSNVSSATDGLSIQQSSDGVNWDHTDDYTIVGGSSKNYSVQRFAKYFRVVYTNGDVSQSEFRLQTILSVNSKPSSHRIKDNIIGDDDAELVKSAITGEDSNGNWKNVQTTEDGNLTVSDNSSGLSIAAGNVTGASFIHKFGAAPDFDTADGSITIWDGANDALLGGGAMSYTYSTTADIGTISSSNTGDTMDIEIQGLDINGDLITQTITLNGQTDVSLVTNLKRVFRMKNIGTIDIAGVVYLRTNGSGQTAGVPTTANTVRALINDGNNQTLMTIYTIPTGYTGYMRDWYASTAGGNKDSSYVIRLFARPSGQVFQLKHISSIQDGGSTYIQHTYEEPEVFNAGTDVVMRVESLASPAATGIAFSAGFDIVLIEN